MGSSSQQAPTHEKGSSSQQAPTHEEQAHHKPLDVEEQLAVDAAVSGAHLNLNVPLGAFKGDKYKKNGNPTNVVAAAPPRVDKVDFAALVTYWYSKDGQDLSDKNKKSCSFKKETHTAGSKSYASHVEEMKEERGVNIPIERAELYEKFYTHKDGTPVNDDAAKNILGKGPKYSGRVRGLGFGPTPSSRNTKTKNYRTSNTIGGRRPKVPRNEE
uniref:Uncharacterized protein n=1 Tax=Fagus sylvatica TaxID=28930 RepID=A0A2N9HRB9_FAGSY